MDFTSQIEANRRALLDDVFRRIERALRPFEEALDAFLATLFRTVLPRDWRERWHAFVAEQAASGLTVEPNSADELEEWIEAWAGYCGLLPPEVDEPEPAVQNCIAGKRPVGRFKRRGAKRPPKPSEAFFYQKLAEARRHLEAIPPILAALGQKLDRAAVDEAVEVEAEADAIAHLIWRHNDALESARDAWLRDDLGGKTYDRLVEMATPAAFGLPLFGDESQAERARRQQREIGRRLGKRIEEWGRLIFALETTETVANYATLAAGVGVVATVARQGGKWAVVKLAAQAGAAMAAGAAVDRGLRAAGAPEEVVHGFRFAAAVVSFVILRRRFGRPAPELPPKPATPKTPAAEPSPPAVRPAGPKGPLKNQSGDPEEASRAARTQPHGPPPAPAAGKKRRLPARGTPERSVIERARRKAIDAAKAKELANIRAGGEGSGVWTESELETIRVSGKFPADVRWHHEPTVANRPDLAGDASIVRPVRGGTKGHLEAHGGDFRKPYPEEGR